MRIPPGMGELTQNWEHHLQINQHASTSLLVEWPLKLKLQCHFWSSGEQEVKRRESRLDSIQGGEWRGKYGGKRWWGKVVGIQ